MGGCCEGVKGGDRELRSFPLPPCRLRRGEIPCDNAFSAKKGYYFTMEVPKCAE